MFGCAVTTSFLGSLAAVLLFLRYCAFTTTNLWLKITWLVVFILIGCLPMLAEYRFEDYLGKFFVPYRYVLYFLFISMVILFSLTVVRDIIWGILRLFSSGFKPFASPHLMTINLITVALALIIGGIALYDGTKVPALKNISVSSPKITQNKKIVLLPDLHLHRALSTKKLQGIVDRTNTQNPDVVLLIGDMIDDDISRVAKQLDILSGLKAKHGVYFVSGNHEFYHDFAKTTNALQDLGFKLLENSGVNIDKDLYVGGIPDIHSSYLSGKKYDLNKTFATASPEQYKILMSHTPANFKNTPFDLEVSGHTHGGQIFPFVFFIYAHAPYVAGWYDLNTDAKIYVSRGAGQWGPQMRFLAPAEITILELKSTQAKEEEEEEMVQNISDKTKAKVYFTSELTPEALVNIYQKVNQNISGKVAIKWHSGEPYGPNILPIPMIKAIQSFIPDSNLVETNTLYEGGRHTTEKHRQTLKINGWDFCKVDIMDEFGTVMLPVRGGKHFKEMSMGKGILDYDSMLVLTHFKGHPMGGFGGSIKNIAIGNADGKIGKAMVHGANEHSLWNATQSLLMENMVESAKATLDHFGNKITYINVLRNMSVDCDCMGTAAAEVKIRDLGILASTDIVALDQASIDLLMKQPETELHDIKERILSREGLHQLDYAEEMGLGTRNYELINLDSHPSGYDQAIEFIRNDNASAVVVKNNQIVAQAHGRGNKPLLELHDDWPLELKDGSLLDTVSGRAAAFIAIDGKVRTVYGELMSEDALELLQKHHIPATYGKLVPQILNRAKDGLCPMEQTVKAAQTPQEALKLLREKLLTMPKNNN